MAMPPWLKGFFIAFWLFCVFSCCMFLYDDFFVATEPAMESTGDGDGAPCPFGYTAKDGEKPTLPMVDKKKKGGEACPLGFGGDGESNPHGGSGSPPINPPIPEQTTRDPAAEKQHRERCNGLLSTANHAAALGCFASEVANRKKLAGLVHLDTADSHERLGTVLRAMGRAQPARERLREALGAVPSSGGGSAVDAQCSVLSTWCIGNVRGRIYGELGRAHRDLGEVPEAMANFMQAQRTFEEIGEVRSGASAALLFDYGLLAAKAAAASEGSPVGPPLDRAVTMLRTSYQVFLSLHGAQHSQTQAAAEALKSYGSTRETATLASKEPPGDCTNGDLRPKCANPEGCAMLRCEVLACPDGQHAVFTWQKSNDSPTGRCRKCFQCIGISPSTKQDL